MSNLLRFPLPRSPFDKDRTKSRIITPPAPAAANTADGAVLLTLSVAAQAVTHADGAVLLTLSVAGQVGKHADGDVLLTLSVAGQGGAQGAVVLTLSVTGTASSVNTADGDVLLTLSVAGQGGAQGAVTLLLSVASTATSLNTADGDVLLTLFVAGQGGAQGAIILNLSIQGGGTNPIHLVPQPNLPCITVNGTLISNGGISAVLSMPIVRVSGSVSNGSSGVVTAWAVNTENFGHTNYDATYNFTDLMMWNALPFGIKTDGIYELVAADDAGTNIAAEFRFGIDDGAPKNKSTDFNKRVDVVYTSGRMDDDLILTVTIDGQATVREYTAARRMEASGVHDARVKLAKGLRGRYWQLGIKNQNGGNFELDRLSAVYRTLKRKT